MSYADLFNSTPLCIIFHLSIISIFINFIIISSAKTEFRLLFSKTDGWLRFTLCQLLPLSLGCVYPFLHNRLWTIPFFIVILCQAVPWSWRQSSANFRRIIRIRTVVVAHSSNRKLCHPLQLNSSLLDYSDWISSPTTGSNRGELFPQCLLAINKRMRSVGWVLISMLCWNAAI